jgi:outer membrane protein assembly factor BamB
MPSSGTRRRPQRWIAAAAVVLLIAGAAILVAELHTPGNVSHPNLEFTTPTVAAIPPRVPPKQVVDTFLWPRYGFDAARTRYLPDSDALAPPFRRGWTYRGTSLLEFPPVLRHGVLFALNDSGVALAIESRTGKVLWTRQVGTLAAASPAVGSGLVFLPLLSTNPGAGQNPGNGAFVALSQKDGHVVWSHPIPSGTESSPLGWGKEVYFGDQAGTVYAMRATDGRVLWRYQASGAVKGGPSIAGGILYFADYAGRVYAVNAASGREVWAVSTAGAHFGFGSGNFYSTPAVAFGRVYLGNTDGRVYSFAAHSGKLAWATSTGAYVYASPAVADIAGVGPTVYIGSYDGRFYAFDARSGRIRWSHAAGGRISGSPTIVGNVVYFSDLGTKSTTGLDARTGRVDFSFGQGAFTPVVADDRAVYLTGYATLFELVPDRSQPAGGSLSGQAPNLRAGVAAKVQNPRKSALRATPRQASKKRK